MIDILEECLSIHTIGYIANHINVSIATIKRWLKQRHIPPSYLFDLYRILSKDIDYSQLDWMIKDQFFTPDNIAKQCWETFCRITKIDTTVYTFIEPSAGDGSFLKVLPHGSIAMDIEPRADGIQQQDYLLWTPPDKTKNYVVIGNPPFGLRGHQAIQFINQSYAFADYVCFILPQLFVSDGKGSPRKRVKGYHLIHSENLSCMFYSPNHDKIKVNTILQIWSRRSINPQYAPYEPSNDLIKIYSLSDGGTPATTRNKAMINGCDIYLPSTCYGNKMKVYQSFDELPNKKGYGIVFLHNKENYLSIARSIKWESIAVLSTNSSYNLRTSIIYKALTEAKPSSE